MRTTELKDLPILMDSFSALSYDHDAVTAATGALTIADCVVSTVDLATLDPRSYRNGFIQGNIETEKPNLEWGQTRIIVTYDAKDEKYRTRIVSRVEDETAKPYVYQVADKPVPEQSLPKGFVFGEDRRWVVTQDEEILVFLKPEEYLHEDEIADSINGVVIPIIGLEQEEIRKGLRNAPTKEKRFFRGEDGKIYIDRSPSLLAKQVDAGPQPKCDFPAWSEAEIRLFGRIIGIKVFEGGIAGLREVDLSRRIEEQDPDEAALSRRLQLLHSMVLKHVLASSIPEETLSRIALEKKKKMEHAADINRPKVTRYWLLRDLGKSETEIDAVLGEGFSGQMQGFARRPAPEVSVRQRTERIAALIQRRNDCVSTLATYGISSAVRRSLELSRDEMTVLIKELRDEIS